MKLNYLDIILFPREWGFLIYLEFRHSFLAPNTFAISNGALPHVFRQDTTELICN